MYCIKQPPRTAGMPDVRRLATLWLLAVVTMVVTGCKPNNPVQTGMAPQPQTARTRIGIASFYARMFAGRTMADGNTMNPHGINAASRTLPLGTIARVTNIETGKSTIVKIEDRGPYAKGRIVDLSPATAQKIGITREKGVAKVAITPIAGTAQSPASINQ